jgi:phospholipase/carboxylesterase
VDAFLAKHGLGSDRLVVGGFSQGAVMSYCVGLGRGRPRPGAITAFSGFIPTVEGFEVDLSPPLPPIAIGHGTHDPVIEVQWGRQARERLEAAGAQVLYCETPMFHQIDPDFVPEVAAWLEGVLAETVQR